MEKYGNDKNIDFSVLERTIKYYLDNWEVNKLNFKRKNYNKWDPTKDHNFLDKDQLYILEQAANALRKYHGLNKFIDNKIKKSSKENDNEKVEIFNLLSKDTKIPSTEFDDFIMRFIEKKKKINSKSIKRRYENLG